MAEVGNLVAKVSMDQTGFQQGITRLNRELKVVQSEFKAASAQLADFGKSTEGLKLKADSLTRQFELQKQKVDALEAAYKKSVESKGADAKATQNLAIQLNNAKAQMTNTEAELKKTTAELEKQSNRWHQLAQSCEAASGKLKDVGGKLSDIGQNMSLKVTAPIAAAGAASFKFAADLQDAFGATEQVYKSAADAVKNWADSLPNYYGIAEGEALEYANMMGSLLQNIGGLTEEQAAKQAQTLIELAGDLTAMYGGSVQDAVRALTGALKGNNSMLDNYGMAVNEAIIKTKAMEMGLVAEGKELDLASKQAATLALIMEQTADAQGQAAREAEGASGSMRSLSKDLKDLATSFGEILLPVITPFIAKLNELLKQFKELSPETQKTIIAIAAVAAAIGPLLTVIGKVITVFGTVMSLVSKLSALLPVLGGAFTVLTGPIGLVIAALGVLVAAGVAVYKNWDEIKAFGQKLWDDLKAAWAKGIEAVKTAWSDFSRKITDTWMSMWNTVMDKYNAVKASITNLTNSMVAWVQDKFTSFKNFFLDIWAGIASGVKGYINNMIRFVNRLIDALNSIRVEIPDWVPGFGGQKFGINIPHIPQLATGINYVPRDMLAYLHKGEAVIPAKYNPYNFQSTATTVIHEIHIHGNNPEEIWQKFERKLHKLGVVL